MQMNRRHKIVPYLISLLVFLASATTSSIVQAANESREIACSTFGTFFVVNNVVTKNSNCSGVVVIPEGVTEIGQYAFSENKNITSVEFGKDVTTIGIYAFMGAKSLKTLSIPNNVRRIGWGAFNDLSNIESLFIGSGALEIDDNNFGNLEKLVKLQFAEGITRLPGNSFNGASSLESLSFPQSLRVIPANTFRAAIKLRSLQLNNGLKEIGFNSLSYLNSIEKIEIPESVEVIGERVFEDLKSLNEFSVASNSRVYSSDSQGVLYDKLKSNLIKAPMNRVSIVIPPSVQFVSFRAFGTPGSPAKSVATLVIPETVKVVDDDQLKRMIQDAVVKAAAEVKAKAEAEAKAKAEAEANAKYESVLNQYQALLERIRLLKIKYPQVSTLSGLEAKMMNLPIIKGSDLSSALYNINSVNSKLDSSEKVWAKTQKTTINCVKGKLTKKVTAINPKCPAGYKKK